MLTVKVWTPWHSVQSWWILTSNQYHILGFYIKYQFLISTFHFRFQFQIPNFKFQIQISIQIAKISITISIQHQKRVEKKGKKPKEIYEIGEQVLVQDIGHALDTILKHPWHTLDTPLTHPWNTLGTPLNES